MLNMKYLEELEEYLTSQRLEDEFEYSPVERRHEILEFLDHLMDLADKADAAATRLLFRKSQLGALLGTPTEK